MLAKLRQRLTYANVVATLALFLALGGVAYAGATIGSADVINESLRSVDLEDDAAVRSSDVRDDTLNGGGLAASDLAPDAVGSSEAQDGGLDTADFADRAVTSEKLGFFAVSTTNIRPNAVVGSKIFDGAVDQPDIDTDGVAAAEIAGGAVKAGELGVIQERTSTLSVPAPGTGIGTAQCGSGEQLLSGGASNAGFIIRESFSNFPDSWTVTARNDTSSTQTLTVYAYCLDEQ